MGNPNPNKENLKPFQKGKDERRTGSGRKPTKFLTDLLIKELKNKEEIVIEGINVVTGELCKVRVPMPTKRNIVQALLRQAKKGNIQAIKEVYDRVEGKTLQPVGLQDKDGNDIPLSIIFQQADNCEPIKDE